MSFPRSPTRTGRGRVGPGCLTPAVMMCATYLRPKESEAVDISDPLSTVKSGFLEEGRLQPDPKVSDEPKKGKKGPSSFFSDLTSYHLIV